MGDWEAISHPTCIFIFLFYTKVEQDDSWIDCNIADGQYNSVVGSIAFSSVAKNTLLADSSQFDEILLSTQPLLSLVVTARSNETNNTPNMKQ